MTSTSDADTTCDAFLGGRLRLIQPVRGYRAGVDPVLLAAATPARPGQSVLELGCGTGAALFCLATRVPDLDLTGVELQPRYGDLARRSAALNGIEARIETADLAALPGAIRQRRFDHVIANPPYYGTGTGTPAREGDRETALREALPLDEWIAAGSRRLEPRGVMSVIQRADRLPDLLAAMTARLGSLDIRPIHPRPGRAAILVIVHGVKGGRAPAKLRAPLVMHEGPAHLGGGEDYSIAIGAVLRGASELS